MKKRIWIMSDDIEYSMNHLEALLGYKPLDYMCHPNIYHYETD